MYVNFFKVMNIHYNANADHKMKSPPVKNYFLPSIVLQGTTFYPQEECSPGWTATEHQPSATGSISLLRLPPAGRWRSSNTLSEMSKSSATVQAGKHQEAQRSWLPESRAANSENFVQRPCFTLLSPFTLMCVSLLSYSIRKV